MPVRIVRDQTLGFCCGQQAPIGGNEDRRGKTNSCEKCRSIECRSKLNSVISAERMCEKQIFCTPINHLAKLNDHILPSHMPIEEVAC